MANIPVSVAIDNLLKSTPSTTVTTAQALTALGAATTGNASIVAGDIADNAVTTAKISNLNVTAGKLAVNAAVGNIVDNTLPVAKITGLGTAATLRRYSANLAGVNYTAVADGSVASDITITHTVSGTGEAVISVIVTGRNIVVTAGSATLNTAVVTAVQATGAATALITASIDGSNNATFYARTATSLTDQVSSIGGPDRLVKTSPQGDIYLSDRDWYGWRKKDGTESEARIYMWEDHDSGGGELILDTPHRIALALKGVLQVGRNDPGAYFPISVELTTGASTASATLKHGGALSFRSRQYDGADTINRTMLQSVPLAVNGTESVLRMYHNASMIGADNPSASSVPNNGVVQGILSTEFHKTGMWHLGQAPSFDVLTAADTITHTVSKYKTVQAAKTTLNRMNTTIAFSGGLAAGMRGVIYVTQDNTGGRLVSLPTGSYKTADFVLSTGAGLVDRLSWEYDGAYYYWTIEKGLETVYDLDTQNFISAISLTDNAQKVAVNNLVLSLKQADLWNRLDAIYPLVGGTNIKHARNLRQDLYHIINDGTAEGVAWGLVTHDTNGVTGNGSTAYGSINGYNLNTLGRLNSVFGYAYSRSTDITALSYLFGATDSTRFGISRTGQFNSGAHGPNDGENASLAIGIANWKGHHAINRSSASAKRLYYNETFGTSATASTTAPNFNMALLARRFSTGPYGGWTNANVAFYAFGTSFSESEFTTFRSIIDTYQTALGRANP